MFWEKKPELLISRSGENLIRRLISLSYFYQLINESKCLHFLINNLSAFLILLYHVLKTHTHIQSRYSVHGKAPLELNAGFARHCKVIKLRQIVWKIVNIMSNLKQSCQHDFSDCFGIFFQ